MDEGESMDLNCSGELVIDMPSGESELSTEVPNSIQNSPLMTSEDPVMTVASNLSDNSESGEASVLVPTKNTAQDITDASDAFEIAENSKLEETSFSPSPELPALHDIVSSTDSSSPLLLNIKECSVVLRKLSKTVIEKYGARILEPGQLKSQKRFSRKENYQDKFSEYRKNRKNFFKKKRRRYSSDKEASNTSNDEYKPPDFNSEKERRKRRRKMAYEEDIDWRPSLDRDDSLAWKPSTSKHKKSEKLRITTRRRRIESASDSDSDFNYEKYMYLSDEEKDKPETSKKSEKSNEVKMNDIYDPYVPIKKTTTSKSKTPKSTAKKSESPVQNTMMDNDVLSYIMQEMENCHMKSINGSQIAKNVFSGSKSQNHTSQVAKNNPLKRKRTGIKVTKNVLPPIVTSVKKLVADMLDTVNSVENNYKIKKCKLCDSQFQSDNDRDILCVICKTQQVLSTNKKSNVKKSSLNEKRTKSVKINPKNKIKSKVLKNLSKYDQQRLSYGESAGEKGFNHCKNFSSTDEFSGQVKNSSASKINKKTVKKKKKSEIPTKENKKSVKPKLSSKVEQKKSSIKTSASSVPKQNQLQTSLPMANSNHSTLQNGKRQNNVEVTSVNKGLFLMTFPDPDKEFEIPKVSKSTASLIKASPSSVATVTQSVSTPVVCSQNSANSPQTTNNQYGTYLMNSVPTLVVANYAGSKAGTKNFVLSNVYYQNEITKKTAVSNANVVKAPVANNSYSMPTVNELTKAHQTVAAPLYQNADITMQPNYVNQRPLLNIPANPANTVITMQPNCVNQRTPLNIPANPVLISKNISIRNVQPSVINSMPNHFQVSQNLVIRNNNPALTSNNNFQISQVQPDLSRLINQCGLQITPAVVSNSITNIPIRPTDVPLVNNFNTTTQSNISRLANNCGLQITSAPIESQQLNSSVINNNTNLTLDVSNSSQNTINTLVNDYGLDIMPSSKATSIEENISQESQTVTFNSNELSVAQNAVENQQTETPNKINEKQTVKKIDSKDFIELEAFSVLSIIDLEKNPGKFLNLKIESNDKIVEETSKDKTQYSNHCSALKTREVLKVAKKWLKQFGSFTRLSEHFLKDESATELLKTPIQIKKEHIEEEEEEMSTCQFSDASSIASGISNASEFTMTANMGNISSYEMNPELLGDVNHIANLAVQVDSIADQSNSAGVDCTISIPGMSALPPQGMLIPPNVLRHDYIQESRETPSRGSGPRTPARPESASSHVEERTPAQIKREKMESAESPFSQCAFSGNNPTVSQPSMSITPLQSIPSNVPQPLGNFPPSASPGFSHMLTPTSLGNNVQSNMPQIALPQGMVYGNPLVMSRQSPSSSLMPNISYSNTIPNQSPNVSIRTMPQGVNAANMVGPSRYGGSTNVVISNANYNSPQIQNVLSYQNQVPPNRTVPFTVEQNMSKILMNLASNPVPQAPNMNQNGANANVILRNQHGQQVYMQQHPGNQLYNVQQVYLPNKTSLLQQTLNNQQNRTVPQSSNQYVMRQVQSTVASTLSGGAGMVNSTTIARNPVQQNMYSHQNNVDYQINHQEQPAQSLGSPVIQQIASPNNQGTSSSPATFLMQNNNKPPGAVSEDVTDMLCAVCKKEATLRCKQCTKVAYCDSSCAKNYWHTRHKLECRPMEGAV